MRRTVSPDVGDADALVFAVGDDARAGAFDGIGRFDPDAPDVSPLMHVLEHRRGGQLFASGYLPNAPIEFAAIVDLVRGVGQLLLEAA